MPLLFLFSSIHPEGIEPPSQEPESYVISITLRVETLIIISKKRAELKFFLGSAKGEQKKDSVLKRILYIIIFSQEEL